MADNKDKSSFGIDHNGKKRKLHHGSRLTLWILLLVGILIVAGLITIAPYMMNGSERDVAVRIPKDATSEQFADTLKKYYPEKYAGRVVRLMKIFGVDPKDRHGYYLIPKGATPFAAARKLKRGTTDHIEIKINGFRSVDYLAERMGLKMEFSKEDFLRVAKDPDYLAKYDLTPDLALALFLDDTYFVNWTDTPEQVLDKIGDNYLGLWSQGRRELAADLDLTPAEVMVLSSLVDDETRQTLEKGRVGRLYINRLDKDMRLQADPTVRFALNDYTKDRLSYEDLKFDSPFNTYVYKGLPPAPIRTTGRTTVSEILNSTPSTDLFMCARPDGSGFHNFAATYDDHLKNAELWHQYLDEREGK